MHHKQTPASGRQAPKAGAKTPVPAPRWVCTLAPQRGKCANTRGRTDTPTPPSKAVSSANGDGSGSWSRSLEMKR